MTQATAPHSTADGISWDLADLYTGVDDPRIGHDLDAALGRAAAFEHAYRGKIAALQPGQASVLLNAVHELESLFEQMDRPAVYAMLHHSAKTDDPARGALLSHTQEERTKIN